MELGRRCHNPPPCSFMVISAWRFHTTILFCLHLTFNRIANKYYKISKKKTGTQKMNERPKRWKMSQYPCAVFIIRWWRDPRWDQKGARIICVRVRGKIASSSAGRLCKSFRCTNINHRIKLMCRFGCGSMVWTNSFCLFFFCCLLSASLLAFTLLPGRNFLEFLLAFADSCFEHRASFFFLSTVLHHNFIYGGGEL